MFVIVRVHYALALLCLALLCLALFDLALFDLALFDLVLFDLVLLDRLLLDLPAERTGKHYRFFHSACKAYNRACNGAYTTSCPGLAESGILQLAINAICQLVQPLINRHFACNHLLHRCGPLSGQIKEQRLCSKVDFCTRC